MFITSKNKYLSNDMKIFGTCSIPLRLWESSYKVMGKLPRCCGNVIPLHFGKMLWQPKQNHLLEHCCNV